MNTSPDPIEAVLRTAPQPRPDTVLRSELIRQINLPGAASARAARFERHRAWLKPWWPALAAGGFALAGLIWVAYQQTEIDRLRSTLDELQRPPSAAPILAPAPTGHEPSAVPIPDGPAELQRLRTTTADLKADIAALNVLRAENERLKSQAAAQVGITAEEYEELAQARERAIRIHCVNNLKQLGLAARIWANDNGDIFPPDFLSVSNEVAVTKVLVCPGDEARTSATNWHQLSTANVSYELLAASATESEPDRVLFRCPIHGTVTLCDGSVQQIPKDAPERLTVRDGKTYYTHRTPLPAGIPVDQARMMRRYGLQPTPGKEANVAPPPGAPPQMNEELMRRYGLIPPDGKAPNQQVPPPTP